MTAAVASGQEHNAKEECPCELARVDARLRISAQLRVDACLCLRALSRLDACLRISAQLRVGARLRLCEPSRVDARLRIRAWLRVGACLRLCEMLRVHARVRIRAPLRFRVRMRVRERSRVRKLLLMNARLLVLVSPDGIRSRGGRAVREVVVIRVVPWYSCPMSNSTFFTVIDFGCFKKIPYCFLQSSGRHAYLTKRLRSGFIGRNTVVV
jgi:hypothetical protein